MKLERAVAGKGFSCAWHVLRGPQLAALRLAVLPLIGRLFTGSRHHAECYTSCGTIIILLLRIKELMLDIVKCFIQGRVAKTGQRGSSEARSRLVAGHAL